MRWPSQTQYGPSSVSSTRGPRSRQDLGSRADHTSTGIAWMSRWSSAEIRTWSAGRDIQSSIDGASVAETVSNFYIDVNIENSARECTHANGRHDPGERRRPRLRAARHVAA